MKIFYYIMLVSFLSLHANDIVIDYTINNHTYTSTSTMTPQGNLNCNSEVIKALSSQNGFHKFSLKAKMVIPPSIEGSDIEARINIPLLKTSWSKLSLFLNGKKIQKNSTHLFALNKDKRFLELELSGMIRGGDDALQILENIEKVHIELLESSNA